VPILGINLPLRIFAKGLPIHASFEFIKTPMSKPQLFGQKHGGGYFALFGHFEGVLIYLALGISMALSFMLSGHFVESAALLAPLSVGLSVLAGLRFRLAGATASALVAVSIFWVAFSLEWGAFPEDGLLFGAGLVFLVYLFAFCASLVVSYHYDRAELATQREGMLRDAMDSLPIGVWVRTKEGRTVFVNQRWADFSSKSVREILESETTDPPVDLGPGWESELVDVLESDRDLVRYRTLELEDNEGRACVLNLLSFKLRIEYLDDYGTLSLLVDETAVRLREQRFEESQHYLSLALNNARMGFWHYSVRERKTECDANWYRIMGMDAEAGKDPGSLWSERLHPDDSVRVLTAYEKFLKGQAGETLDIDCRVQHADGSYIWVQDRARIPEYDPDGTPLRVTGTMQDISDRKEIEIDLKKAKDSAEVANAAKGQFIAAISHEIRTPLNAIIGLSSFLAESGLDEEQADLASTVHSSGCSLLALVNDLLDFSKIEAGRLELEVQEYPVRLLFEDCVKLFKLRAEEKNITLDLMLEAELVDYAMGDMHRLRQIVQNLLANAIKFTDKGGVKLRARKVKLSDVPAEHRPDPLEPVGFLDQPDHEYLEVCVQDSGIGIAKEQQHLLFEAFSQVDASSTRRYEGTGLGLVICKRLINGMGGRIWVESNSGEGSKFCFVVRTKFLNEKSRVEQYTRTPFDPVHKIAKKHPCDILIVGKQEASAPMVAACRHLGYAPHQSVDFDLSNTAYRRRHYDLLFISMQDSAKALEFTRKVRLDGTIKQPESIIGFGPGGRGISAERCRLSGMQGVICELPEPKLVQEAILSVLHSDG